MEELYNQAKSKMDALEKAIAEYEEFQSAIQELEEYYTSDDWKEDFRLDEEGKLPADLKRGVLSEDGVYDLLERNAELIARLTGEVDEYNG